MPARLLDCGLYDPEQKIPDVKRWLAEEPTPSRRTAITSTTHDPNRHDERIRAFTLATDRHSGAVFEMFLELVRSLHGPNLLRLKGIVKIAEDARGGRW